MKSQTVLLGIVFCTISFIGNIAAAEFIRKVEMPNGIELQTKVAKYQFKNSSTQLDFVGIVHVGEESYYKAAADVLTGCEVELFEGVSPIGFYGTPFINDPDFSSAEMRQTRTRLRFYSLQKMAREYTLKIGKAPKTLVEFFENTAKSDRYGISQNEALDAWGNPFQLVWGLNGNFSFLSFGADGKPGGDGLDQDLFSSSHTLSPKFDSDVLMQGLGAAYQQLADDGELLRQPRSLNYLGKKSIRADVSSDLLFGDPTNDLAVKKYWLWREALPGVLLSTIVQQAPSRICIIYGAGHGDRQEQSILGVGFTKIAEHWEKVFSVTGDQQESVQSARKSLIEKILID